MAGAKTRPRTAPVTWRPTADSFRNLAVMWSGLAVAATATAATVTDAAVLATLVGLALAGGLVTAVTVSRSRLTRALQAAGRPSIANWPPKPAERERSRRAGWANARKAAVVALVVGAVSGLVPVVGAGVAAAGWAGAVGSVVGWRTVRRYEGAEGVVVVTARPGRQERRRGPLELGRLERPAT